MITKIIKILLLSKMIKEYKSTKLSWEEAKKNILLPNIYSELAQSSEEIKDSLDLFAKIAILHSKFFQEHNVNGLVAENPEKNKSFGFNAYNLHSPQKEFLNSKEEINSEENITTSYINKSDNYLENEELNLKKQSNEISYQSNQEYLKKNYNYENIKDIAYENLLCQTKTDRNLVENEPMNFPSFNTSENPKQILSNFPFKIPLSNENDIKYVEYSADCIYNKNIIHLLFDIIEQEYIFDLSYIMNKVNRTHKIRRTIRDSGCINYLVYIEFYFNLSVPYEQNSKKIYLESKFEMLHHEFRKFKNWIRIQYRMEDIETAKNYYKEYDKILSKLKERIVMDSENILSHCTSLFTSNNFDSLFKVLPGLNFLHFTKNIKPKSLSVKILLYLQLLICKFETFRFSYAYESKKIGECLENLYKNQQFNETIAIMGVILKRILEYTSINSNTLDILELLNFAYFVRAKYNDIYNQTYILKSISDYNFFQNYILFWINSNGELESFSLSNELINHDDFISCMILIARNNGKIRCPYRTDNLHPSKKQKIS
ncbi:hypothetical protein H312_00674 [Anncaliia algerae PRA339]|uniref:Uncharacterized protein n=1 Tax=Anncaliia algerae PRA339 TaxID=1288291 RepID=A0A059F3P9_9MICR|nr:hypothetical protein H312_00674 [Anncaliia algerae PRA339]